eukprot:CAMPEP_0195623898 /NCGR_PEP_ID=MMETSP0815-20121206/17004_1 /TAXON_ID=97485 /ORGANISM="Prymnesium parvum, Strain Texoma1" /LENGTH=49 /DNA_ID= /DNA_START= /DNA_END= /DNA_ORIENTATION=
MPRARASKRKTVGSSDVQPAGGTEDGNDAKSRRSARTRGGGGAASGRTG